MKKASGLFMLLFFLITFFCNLFFSQNTNKMLTSYANGKDINKIITINCGEKTFNYEISENNSFIKNFYTEKMGINRLIDYLKSLKFSEEEIVCYIYPQMKDIFENLECELEESEGQDEILIEKNKCRMNIKNGKFGQYLNKRKFFETFLSQLKNNKNNINLSLKKIKYKKENLNKNEFLKRSEFSTSFYSSSDERKNNIRLALSQFDGIILNEGEHLSFNMITGVRSKEKGYAAAKIISGGTFTSGYGGGVCQVSTTIYNACLLAGLEIVEVHNHSLPVSYIQPCFDAMVNMGSSDFVIKNNTGGKLVFTTSSENDICKVVIFGKENKYKIERISKKIETIKASDEKIIETDYKKFGIEDISENQEIVISNAKDGFKAEGYLNFYDENGVLIKTEKIRECVYRPTKAVSVKKKI